jgi:hypothetical protein
MLDISLLLTEFIKIVQNDILHVQCTTHNAVIPFCKLTDRFKCEHPVNATECFWLADFWPTLHDTVCSAHTLEPISQTERCHIPENHSINARLSKHL